MKLERWNFTVQVTVDLEARGGWKPEDVAQEIDSTVSQLEGVANVDCKQVSPKSYVCADDSPLLPQKQR